MKKQIITFLSLVGYVVPMLILIVLFRQNFSVISLFSLIVGLYGAILFSSIQFGLKGLFPTILGFVFLISSYFMLITQSYWLLLVIPFSIMFGKILPEEFQPSNTVKSKQKYSELDKLSISKEIWEFFKSRETSDFQRDLEYTFCIVKDAYELGEETIKWLQVIISNGGYSNIISFHEGFAGKMKNICDDNQLTEYILLVGGAYQEIGNFEQADFYFNIYIKSISINDEDRMEELSESAQKLAILIGGLDELSIPYRIEKGTFSQEQIEEMKKDLEESRSKNTNTRNKKGKL